MLLLRAASTKQVFAMYEDYAAAGCPVLRVTPLTNLASGSYTVAKSMVVGATGPGNGTGGMSSTSRTGMHVVQDASIGNMFPRAGPKVGVAVGFGEHGRELISSEIGMRLCAMLCAPWAEANKQKLAAVPSLLEHHRLALVGLQQWNRELSFVTALLDRVWFKLIPVENPNGREIVEVRPPVLAGGYHPCRRRRRRQRRRRRRRCHRRRRRRRRRCRRRPRRCRRRRYRRRQRQRRRRRWWQRQAARL